MKPRKLFIITPLSNKDRFSLAGEGGLDTGDLIVDLCRFPHVVSEIGADKTYTDITDKLLKRPDYWAVAESWLSQMTKGTRLQDKLEIDGYGFWWTVNSLRFEPGVSDYGNCFEWVDLLNAVCRQIRVRNIIVRGQHEAIADIVRQVFKGVDVDVVVEKTCRAEKGVVTNSSSGLRLFRILLSIVFVIYASFRHPAICFFSSTNLLRTKMNGGKRKLQDVYLGEIGAAIRRRGWRVAYVEHYGTNASWRGILARRFFFPAELIRNLGSLLLSSFGGFGHLICKWEKSWEGFNKSINPFVRYKGVDLGVLVVPLIRNQFLKVAPKIEVQAMLWYRLLRRWKPKVLYVNNSYGALTVPAIIAAKSLGIVTIEQQHGIIGKNHKAYLVPADLESNTTVPRCDYMILWGDYARRLLLASGAYSDPQLAVCGFPRIDFLKRGIRPRSVNLPSMGMPLGAQVVLYTSNLIVQDLYPTILDSLEKGNCSTVYWIIKLHPGEKTRHLWEDAIRRRKLKQVKVVQEEIDFYELMGICDVHVSFVSTTIIEAAVLGKLNVGLYLANVRDPVGYEECKAYLPVPPHQLCESVLNLLNDASQKDKLLEQQTKFAKDWCRKDGRAVKCIVKFIEKIMEE